MKGLIKGVSNFHDDGKRRINKAYSRSLAIGSYVDFLLTGFEITHEEDIAQILEAKRPPGFLGKYVDLILNGVSEEDA